MLKSTGNSLKMQVVITPKSQTSLLILFATYFKSINSPDSEFYQPEEDVIVFNERYVQGEFIVMFDELNASISNDEILKACSQVNNGKSGGPDKFLNEFLKYGIDCFLPCVNRLFNKIFDLGNFPEEWTHGYIIPLHKKGDINNHENYRGITLLSTLGKLYTRLINNRLYMHRQDLEQR